MSYYVSIFCAGRGAKKICSVALQKAKKLLGRFAEKAVDEDTFSEILHKLAEKLAVVVPKRAAVLLDRIMVALQKAVDEDTLGPRKMDLERRGRKEGGRVYWRCYFNAVTCF
ncbi:hypothetical protein J6590_065366 [Homalodisca vitripennis]|nr:hypothetical protein J6590_065366 [Homalodisca vitripennis]